MKKKKKPKLEISYDHEPESKKFPGKMDVEIVVDTSQWDEYYNGMTEQEKIDYWNKQCKKGEANL